MILPSQKYREYISIHAPREGGRRRRYHIKVCPLGISIHAPREGGDATMDYFQRNDMNFNPRPPRGGRLNGVRIYGCKLIISIHAPREGGDREVYIFTA